MSENSASQAGSSIFNYPQGDDRQSNWMQKYAIESPFYLKKHMPIRSRYTNELIKLTALENARQRYENTLSYDKKMDEMFN